MKGEGKQVRILIGVAILLCALIIGYNFFFVQEPSPVIVVTDVSGAPSEGLLSPKVNLNTATETELQDILPGVGPVLAKRIVEYRQEVGGFASIDELKNVAGIGEKTFADLKNFITV